MTISVADLEAAGLYDPAAPDAGERLELLEWLAERGATIDQMTHALRSGSLLDVAGDLGRARGERVTLAEVSARTGIPADHIATVRVVSGLPPLAPNQRGVTMEEARSLAVFFEGERLFGKTANRRLIRVLGAALAKAAEAAVSMSVVTMTEPLIRGGGTQMDLAEARFRVASGSRALADALAQLFLTHMEDAVRRLVPKSVDSTASLYTAPMAVGFVDLVGFTTLARQVEPKTLAEILDRFEETAHDVAVSHGGRIVKFIGDEVMFVSEDASTACDIALSLLESFANDASVTPRGAVAAGDVVIRGGDYYGATVNLASRLAQLAVPAEVLVTERVATDAGAAALLFEPAGRRVLKGFEAPVRVLTVERAPTGR